jgi:hypothetical protein
LKRDILESTPPSRATSWRPTVTEAAALLHCPDIISDTPPQFPRNLSVPGHRTSLQLISHPVTTACVHCIDACKYETLSSPYVLSRSFPANSGLEKATKKLKPFL